MQIYPSCLHDSHPAYTVHTQLHTYLVVTYPAYPGSFVHHHSRHNSPNAIKSYIQKFFCEYLTKGRHKPPLLSSITLVVRKLLPPSAFAHSGSWRVPNHNFSQSAFAKYCLWANWKAQQYSRPSLF